jgi:hypothetical protein
MMHLLFVLIGIALCALTLPLALELFLVTFSALVYKDNAAKDNAEHEDSLADPQLRLTVIIAAHNEEKLIGRTIASIQAANATHIHVIAHNCTDATAQIAREAGAKVTELNGPTGKGHALLHAFTYSTNLCHSDPERSEGEESHQFQAPSVSQDQTPSGAFLILDADTTIAADLITIVHRALAVDDAVQCRYEATFAPGPKAQLSALAFRAINIVRPRGREQLGLSCGILGNGFALRATVLDRVPYNAHSIVEDIEFHLALVRAGIRVRYLDSARLYGEVAGGREQHARWEGGRLRLARQKLPGLLKLILNGHFRLIEPALDLASLPQTQAILLLLLALALPLFWLRAYAVCALFVIALHVAFATTLAPDPATTLRALLLAPLYIVRKLVGTKATLRSAKSQAAWQRAERDTRPGSKS